MTLMDAGELCDDCPLTHGGDIPNLPVDAYPDGDAWVEDSQAGLRAVWGNGDRLELTRRQAARLAELLVEAVGERGW